MNQLPRETGAVSHDQSRHGPPGDSGSTSPSGLDANKHHEAEKREAPGAAVIHEAIRREAEHELERTPWALTWSGLAAGLSMGLSLLASAALHHGLPDAPWRVLLVALGYPLGFLVVILGSQQLYTENTLTPVVSFLDERSGAVLAKLLRLWAIVLAANLVGTFLFGLAMAQTRILSPELRDAMTAVAAEATAGDAATVFVRGIAAGWIVALLVWTLPGAHTAKVPVIFVMTWLIGALGLTHVIAGAAEVFYLAASGHATFADGISRFILPSLAGNTLGGVVLVAMVNHAQVAASKG